MRNKSMQPSGMINSGMMNSGMFNSSKLDRSISIRISKFGDNASEKISNDGSDDRDEPSRKMSIFSS